WCTNLGSGLRPSGLFGRMRQLQEPAGPDVVQLVTAVVERPVTDSYLSRDIWRSVDEQIVPPERKAVLAEHGLRVGLIGGLSPPELLGMLTSEQSCADPRRHVFHAGKPVVLPLGAGIPQLRLEMPQNGENGVVVLSKAVCQLEIVAAPLPDGQT